jgi:hypothetical protein
VLDVGVGTLDCFRMALGFRGMVWLIGEVVRRVPSKVSAMNTLYKEQIYAILQDADECRPLSRAKTVENSRVRHQRRLVQ